MIKSMTGFGRSVYEKEGREYLIEIKSVNNRFTDFNIKMPRSLNYMEETIKKEMLKSVTRGKIDIYITFNNNSDLGKKISINTEIAKLYIDELKKLSKESQIIDNINIMDISKFPDVLNIKVEETAEQIIKEELLTALKQAINSFIDMRQKEGEKIKQDLSSRIEKIIEKINLVSNISTGLVEE